MTEPAPRAPELPALTSIRFFAAIAVVAHHYAPSPTGPGAWVADSWIKHGFVGVSLFFVLSGFILTYTYAPIGVVGSVARKRFGWARVARIYPMHVLGLSLCAPVVIAHRIAKDGVPTGIVTSLIAASVNLSMLGAWLQFAASAWNFPSWSLSAEAFFYACFPLVLGRIAGLDRRRLVLVGLAVFGLGMALPVAFALPGRAWRLAMSKRPPGLVGSRRTCLSSTCTSSSLACS